MDKIILCNDAEIDTDFCVCVANQLMLTVYGINIREAAELFGEPRNVAAVTHRHANGGRKDYAGYTRLCMLSRENDHIRLTLEKE